MSCHFCGSINSHLWNMFSLVLLLFMLFYYIVTTDKFLSWKSFLLSSKTIFSVLGCFVSFHLWHFHCGSFLSNFSCIYPEIFMFSNIFLHLLFSHHMFSLGNIPINPWIQLYACWRFLNLYILSSCLHSRPLYSIAYWLYLSDFPVEIQIWNI